MNSNIRATRSYVEQMQTAIKEKDNLILSLFSNMTDEQIKNLSDEEKKCIEKIVNKQ